MVKVFFLQTGACLVADEEIVNGKRIWKAPLFMSYAGAKIDFKSLYHYTKGNDFEIKNADILIEDEPTDALLAHYNAATEKFTAGKAGLIIPDLKPPGDMMRKPH